MKRLNENALSIIRIMSRDLHFTVNSDSLLCNPLRNSSDIHITLDTDCQDFYYNFFANICKQMQLLTVLGDKCGAEHVLSKTKNDLSTIVERATQTQHHIVFFIPKLEACLKLEEIN